MNDNKNMSALLVEQIDRLLSSVVDVKLLRAVENGSSAHELLDAIDSLGLDTALVAEHAGGAGLHWTDVGGIFEALGYHVAPVVLGETMIANWALSLTGLPLSAKRPSIAIEMFDLDANDGSVSGSGVVPWTADVDLIVAIAKSGETSTLCALDPQSGTARLEASVSRDARMRFSFSKAVPIASAPADFGPYGLEAAVAVLRAAQISGALSRLLALSIDYGNTRVQFGRPIGKFQAIQHMIAELASEAAAAKTAVQLALTCLDAGTGFEGPAIAKIRASAAVDRGAAVAHAVHGAIGVTEEHMVHYYSRRAWQWRADAGDDHLWSERLGYLILNRPGERLWPELVVLAER